MKPARRIGIVLPAIIFLLAALVYGAGYLLPARMHAERATYIDVSPEMVYGLVSDLRHFEQWTPWQARDPEAGYRVGQPDRGLGATLKWQNQDSVIGAGSLSVIDAQPNRQLRLLLAFDNGTRAVLAFRFEPLESGTHIVWTLDSDYGESPISRYRGLLAGRRLKAAFEPGLDRLRRLAERQPATPLTNVVSEEITYQANDQSVTGYLAYDQNRQHQSGVLIVGEGREPDETLRKRAGQLAELGYVALAVGVGEHVDVAMQQFMTALKKLKEHPSTNPEHIAAIGYGIGGDIVLNMARADMDLDGVVTFCASLMPHNDKAQKGGIKASILVLNGADDPKVSSEQRQAFRDEMDAAGADYEFINYPGAAHAFTETTAYNAAADRQSWQQVRTFLARVFR